MNPEELKVLEERIKANPKSRSFLQLAEAYIEAGRRKEALDLLKNGEEYYPYYLAARIAYGKLLREEGETDRSIEQFEFVNRTIPDNLIALKNLAALYFEKTRLPEAKTMATSALALSPGDPEMTKIVSEVDALTAPSPKPAAPPPPAKPEPLPSPPEKTPEPVVPEEPVAPEEPLVLEETIVEMPHELFEKAEQDSLPAPPEPPPSAPEPLLPQTETMGDLLANQGHFEEALSVYETVLAKDPGNASVPEKIHSIRAMRRMVEPIEPVPPSEPEPEPVAPPEEISEPEPEVAPAPEPEAPAVSEPAPPSEPEPAPHEEPQIPEEEPAAEPLPEPEPAFVPSSSPVSLPEGVAGRVVEGVQNRMRRHLLGYVRATLDGFSMEASDAGHWGDILAAEGVEIVRAVSDMTRMLNWGELQGTVVWMDRAVLYGLPLGPNEALFLALKPGANIGLCRILVTQAIEEALKDKG